MAPVRATIRLFWPMAVGLMMAVATLGIALLARNARAVADPWGVVLILCMAAASFGMIWYGLDRIVASEHVTADAATIVSADKRMERELWLIEDEAAMRAQGASEREIRDAQAGHRAAIDRMNDSRP